MNQNHKEDLYNAFKYLDENGDGLLSYEELVAGILWLIYNRIFENLWGYR